MKILRSNIANDLYILSFMVFRVTFSLAIVFILDLEMIFYYCTLMLAVPSIYLHLKYQLNDQDKSIELIEDRMFLLHNSLKIDLTNAKKVVFHCSVGLTRSVIPIFISLNHYNVIFEMDNGEKFSVSSILDRKLKLYIYERVNSDIISYDPYILY